jgi:hypothetical protein
LSFLQNPLLNNNFAHPVKVHAGSRPSPRRAPFCPPLPVDNSPGKSK